MRRLDFLTIVAIAIVAYILANVIHEGLGHGGACFLLGGRAEQLSSLHFSFDPKSVTPAEAKFIAAAGCIANVIAAAIGLLLYRRRRSYFLWLFTTINLLMPAGYLLFSGVLNVGDWVQVCAGIPQLVWRPILAVIGGASYYLAARYCARLLEPLARKDDARRFTLIAYFTGGILYCGSGLFNPVGPIIIAISGAAASFGGTSGLVWMIDFICDREGESVPIERSYAWIGVAAVMAIVFVGVLGPAINF